jgi:ABC-type sugar transport system ATPase subunit
MTLPAPNPPIVEVTGVTKRFPGVLALQNVSVAFRKGEVHAVVGENGAGKSTLMNILAGELRPDSGEIKIDGMRTAITSPLVSQKLGIKVVYQELSLCPNLSVAENVMLPSAAARSPLSLVRRAEMRQAARKVLARLGSSALDPATPVRRLSVAQAQLVEIARAISQKARVLVLDEPNSALSHRESENLFAIVRQLRDEGVTVIYISHHLNEVLGIADRITVMRDGRSIETMDNVNLTEARLIAGMIGRDMGATPQYAVQPGAAADDRPVVLAVENLASAPEIRRVSFQLRRGEILGIGGLPDSGKDELASALFGLKPRQGEVKIDGRVVPPESTRHAIRGGMALIPADRRGAGALLSMSVAENVVSASLPKFSLLGFQRRGAIRREARAQVARLDARVSHLGQRLATLSGGNQQKIILSRGLVTSPDILILHEPTRGIDVGAKGEIYAILKGIAQEGVGILMISSELPELVLHSARVLVMRDGMIAGEMAGADITEEAILACALAS